MHCPISQQIAINADEQEGYCPSCDSPVTEQHYAGSTWLECDNEQCDFTINLKGDE